MDDTTKELLTEGLTNYGTALRAIKTFEGELGSACERAIEAALEEMELPISGSSDHKRELSWQPWVQAWTPFNLEDDRWTVWAGVKWNLAAGNAPFLVSSIYGTPKHVPKAALKLRDGRESLSRRISRTDWACPLDPKEPFEERLSSFVREVVEFHIEAAGADADPAASK